MENNCGFLVRRLHELKIAKLKVPQNFVNVNLLPLYIPKEHSEVGAYFKKECSSYSDQDSLAVFLEGYIAVAIAVIVRYFASIIAGKDRCFRSTEVCLGLMISATDFWAYCHTFHLFATTKPKLMVLVATMDSVRSVKVESWVTINVYYLEFDSMFELC